MQHNATPRPPFRWILVIGLAVLLFAGETAQQNRAAPIAAEANAGQTDKDPLVELNSRFRAAYAQARKELLAKQGPVIIADGDSVILLRSGQRTEVNVTAKADIVKPIGHLPLAIHALLASAGEAELTEERLKELRSIRELLEPDTVIGTDFFNDPVSMHRDLLADGAAAHLKKMTFDQAK
jgi:hypothetical protein